VSAEVEKKVVVEPVGKSEGDWSAAPRSSTGLPEFVEGEYTHMIETGEEDEPALEEADAAADAKAEANPEPASGDEPEEDELSKLDAHMDALLAAGGKDRDGDFGGSLRERIVARLPRVG
jgi:hypothetical protein